MKRYSILYGEKPVFGFKFLINSGIHEIQHNFICFILTLPQYTAFVQKDVL